MTMQLYLLECASLGTKSIEELLILFPKLLQESIKNKILRYRLLEDQWRALFSELLMRKILAQELHLPLASIEIEISPWGKPQLKQKEREFNLSHSKNLIVLATDRFPIGVDVEYVKRIEQLDQLISHCFSSEEQQSFKSLNDLERLEHFYKMWTLKESYVKATGRGMHCPLNSFTIQLSQLSVRSPHDSQSWFFKTYRLLDNYWCAACAQHSEFPSHALPITCDQLLATL